MNASRRRFLCVAAAFAAAPASARPNRWHGRAFGADVSLVLHGPERKTNAAITQARSILSNTEKLFSLYDPTSDLVRLNRTGKIRPHPHFVQLLHAANLAHDATGGLFDPTVQPLWDAAIQGRDPESDSHLVGWEHVRFDAGQVTLSRGQALTFNGIAQGFATDLVSNWLHENGFENTLVNIGEHRGNGGPWTLALEDPVHGVLGTRTLTTGAIATSSPLATPVGATGHIFHPVSRPQWSTVSVEAHTATLADALSTGTVLADFAGAKRIRKTPGVHRITLIDALGDVTTL